MRHVAAAHEDFAHRDPGALVLEQHALQAALREQVPFDEDSAELLIASDLDPAGDVLRATLDGECRGNVHGRDDAMEDQELPEQHPTEPLLLQPVIELVLVERTALDEQLAERSPGVLNHGASIGTRPELQ